MLRHDKCASFESEIINLREELKLQESQFISKISVLNEEIDILKLQKLKLIDALEQCLIMNPLDPFRRADMIRRVLRETKE